MNTPTLGRKPAILDSRTLKFSEYLLPALPPPPVAVNYGKAIKKWPEYYNLKYGDCTCAAAAHMIQNWTAHAGKEFSPSDADVLKFYEHFTTPSINHGCYMIDVLKYWQKSGLGKHKIMAYAKLEHRNTAEIMDSVHLFGGCYIGINLPRFAVQQNYREVSWVVPQGGAVGKDAKPDPNEGHCIPVVGYDSRNLYVVTWGAMRPMSWQFYKAYADEAFAVLSTDFLKNGKSPHAGFDMKRLQADLAAVKKISAGKAKIQRPK